MESAAGKRAGRVSLGVAEGSRKVEVVEMRWKWRVKPAWEMSLFSHSLREMDG